MATITYYLEPETEFPDKDVKVLESKFKGKVHKAEFGESDVQGDKVKSQAVAEKKITKQIIENLGLSGKAEKLLASKAKFEGKLTKADDYDFFINVNGVRYKSTLELIFPEVKEAKKIEYTLASPKLKGLLDDKMIKKIESVTLAGSSEKGHGKVPYLDGALHAHVTNTHAIAWTWKGETMHIVAVGKKNNQNKAQQRGGSGPKLKTAEYDWDEG